MAPFHEMMIFVPIRAHSWFWVLFVYFVPIRGSVFSFRVFRVFRGSTHSRRFVVQTIRVHSCPFVILVFLFVYFVCFVVQSIRAHSWLLVQFQRKKFKKQAASDVFLK